MLSYILFLNEYNNNRSSHDIPLRDKISSPQVKIHTWIPALYDDVNSVIKYLNF